MLKSLAALMNEIVDYAGLFPPARLDMRTAVENFAAYRSGNLSWMLGRFICPATRLEEMEGHAAGLMEDDPVPWRVSVLGRGGEDAGAFLDGLEKDLALASAFATRRRGRAAPDAVEVRLPAAVLSAGDPEAIRETLRRASAAVGAGPATIGSVFYETGFTDGWEEVLPRAATILAEESRRVAPLRLGLKVRTGGTEAPAFPSSARVARYLDACRRAALPVKATAGLHHPVRSHREEVGTRMHGFLNVFAGASLAYARDLGADALAAMLEDERPDAFRFDDAGLSWENHRAGVRQIEAARRSYVLSFGSCSFTEPVEDLEALGLLP